MDRTGARTVAHVGGAACAAGLLAAIAAVVSAFAVPQPLEGGLSDALAAGWC